MGPVVNVLRSSAVSRSRSPTGLLAACRSRPSLGPGRQFPSIEYAQYYRFSAPLLGLAECTKISADRKTVAVAFGQVLASVAICCLSGL